MYTLLLLTDTQLMLTDDNYTCAIAEQRGVLRNINWQTFKARVKVSKDKVGKDVCFSTSPRKDLKLGGK